MSTITMFFHAGTALIAGLCYYLCRRPAAAVTRIFRRLFGIGVVDAVSVSGRGVLLMLIDCYLADFLWAYAMTFCINAVFHRFPSKKRFGLFLCLSADIAMELLQAFHLITGTFDPWDILVQISATLIAQYIINTSHRKREQHVSEQQQKFR